MTTFWWMPTALLLTLFFLGWLECRGSWFGNVAAAFIVIVFALLTRLLP